MNLRETREFDFTLRHSRYRRDIRDSGAIVARYTAIHLRDMRDRLRETCDTAAIQRDTGAIQA